MHSEGGCSFVSVTKPNPENCKDCFSTQYNTEHFLYSPLLPPEKHHKFDHGLTQILHDDLHWLSVADRVTYKLGVIMHKC